MSAALEARAAELKRLALVVYYAARDPRTPASARWLAIAVAAYAFSPIDLIPDFIPVLGLLDDLVLVPLGIALVMRRLPAPVLESARARATQVAARPTSRTAALVIVAVWAASLVALAAWAYNAI